MSCLNVISLQGQHGIIRRVQALKASHIASQIVLIITVLPGTHFNPDNQTLEIPETSQIEVAMGFMCIGEAPRIAGASGLGPLKKSLGTTFS